MNTLLLLFADATANTGAHICLKRSAERRGIRSFILWQAAGNLAAFLGVLVYTVLLRGMSLHVAYPVTEGLTAVGVQLIGGLIVFRERIPPLALAGTGLILSGIVLFSL
jgi:multidrug transporter EmrE-like cation transporter